MENNITSYIWKFGERILTHATTFVVSIILARFLSPSDYGTLALIMVFVTLSQVLVEGGLSSALIQRKVVSKDDYNLVFTITLLFSIVLYALLYIFAGYYENWVECDNLAFYFRVVGLILFPYSILSIIKAKLVREMRFKIQTIVTFISAIVSGFLGILIAYLGYGILALIVQQLLMCLLMLIFYVSTIWWIPLFTFKLDLQNAKSLYNYGLKIMFSNLMVRAYNEVVSLAIGKQFNSSYLGLYDRGKQFPQAAAENIEGTVQSVLFPILSKSQNDKEIVREKTKNMQIVSSYIYFYIMSFLAASSFIYIPLLLTDKWAGCVPYLILWTVCYFPEVSMVISITAINAMGYSNMTLYRQLLTTIPTLVITIIAVFLSKDLISVMIVKVCLLPYSFYVTGYYLNKAVGYTIYDQIKDLTPSFCLAIIVFAMLLLLNGLPINPILLIFIEFLTSVLIYMALSYLLKLKGLLYLVQFLKQNVIKR